MKKLTLSFYTLSISALLFSVSCSEEASVQPGVPAAESGINGKKTLEREIDDLADQPNPQRVPYPEITHQTFIPDYDFFAHTKCQYWRIEWPVYDASVPNDRIPGVFSTNNGALNSFYYLNNVWPSNTYNAQMSLYSEAKVRTITGMWADLDYASSDYIDYVKFSKYDIDEDNIEYWVTTRPDLFEIYWGYYADPWEKLDYEEGDFFLFKNEDKDLYGGVRIASMSPRIIEVYLAEPV